MGKAQTDNPKLLRNALKVLRECRDVLLRNPQPKLSNAEGEAADEIVDICVTIADAYTMETDEAACECCQGNVPKASPKNYKVN
jgi:hypothetical protein